MSEVDGDAEWLTAREALIELAQGMSPHAAMNQLPDALRVGKVRARATLAIITRDGVAEPQRFDRHIVPTEWWLFDRRHSRLGGKASKIDFDAGSYDAITSLDGHLHHVSLKLLRFSAVDLRSYFGTKPVSPTPPTSPSSPAPVRNQGGAPRDSEKWDAVIVAIARFASEGRLDPSMDVRFKTQSEMRRAVLDDAEVARLQVSDDTIKPTVRKVFVALLGSG